MGGSGGSVLHAAEQPAEAVEGGAEWGGRWGRRARATGTRWDSPEAPSEEEDELDVSEDDDETPGGEEEDEGDLLEPLGGFDASADADLDEPDSYGEAGRPPPAHSRPAPPLGRRGVCPVCRRSGEAYAICPACPISVGGPVPLVPTDARNDPLIDAGDLAADTSEDEAAGDSEATELGSMGRDTLHAAGDYVEGECMGCEHRGPLGQCPSCGAPVCAPGTEYYFGEVLSTEEAARRRGELRDEAAAEEAGEGGDESPLAHPWFAASEWHHRQRSAGALSPPPSAVPGLPATVVRSRGRPSSLAGEEEARSRSRSRERWPESGEGSGEDEYGCLE